jgi:hypothetical protein
MEHPVASSTIQHHCFHALRKPRRIMRDRILVAVRLLLALAVGGGGPPGERRNLASLGPTHDEPLHLVSQRDVVAPLRERARLSALGDLHQTPFLVTLGGVPLLEAPRELAARHASDGSFDERAPHVRLLRLLRPALERARLTPTQRARERLPHLVPPSAARVRELLEPGPRLAHALVHELPQANLDEALEELLAQRRGVVGHDGLPARVRGLRAPRLERAPLHAVDHHRARGGAHGAHLLRARVRLPPGVEGAVHLAPAHLRHRAPEHVLLLLEPELHHQPAAPGLVQHTAVHAVHAALEKVLGHGDGVLHLGAHPREGREVLERHLDG